MTDPFPNPQTFPAPTPDEAKALETTRAYFERCEWHLRDHADDPVFADYAMIGVADNFAFCVGMIDGIRAKLYSWGYRF